MKKLIFIITLFSLNSYADRNTSIRAMALANGSLMATPHMPSMDNPKGKWEFGIQLAQFEGKKDGESTRNKEFEFAGKGATFLFNKQSSESFSWYLMAMGNQATGKFVLAEQEPGGPDYDLTLSDVESSLTMGGLGVSYTLFKKSFFPIQFFGGPGISQTKVEQRVQTDHPTDPDDFDMKLDANTPILIAGMQVGLRVSNWLLINPYYIMTRFLDEEDKCQEFEVTAVRERGNIVDFSDPNCQEGQNSSTSKVEYDIAFSAIGVNIVIPTWGFSFNIHSEFEGPRDFESVEFTMVSFGFMF